jgi:hypothetical protein
MSALFKMAAKWGLKIQFCGIVSANLKMETGRNFSMSGIISGR